MSKTYMLVHFYPRGHRQEGLTKQEAKTIMAARAAKKSPTVCYTELWEMDSPANGEQVGFFENGLEMKLTVEKYYGPI
jgi:hypothetical protein